MSSTTPEPAGETSRILVVCRSRPLLPGDGTKKCALLGDKSVTLPSNDRYGDHSFSFDHVFASEGGEVSDVEQAAVYNAVGQPILRSVLKGFHACIFAYGQTGAGKSYTMSGTSDAPGIIPRLCRALCSAVAAESTSLGSSSNSSVKYAIEASYLEIYQEKVKCLLNPKMEGLKVREHPTRGPYVDRLTKVRVDSLSEIQGVLTSGESARATASTKMNQRSSRSHALLLLQVTRTEECSVGDKAASSTRASTLTLVDLAGSERQKKTGATGDRLQEGGHINRSLTVLGQVISALAAGAETKKKGQHIPFRDSMLTWLLRESLSGNSKTVMLAAISLAPSSAEETLSTCRYASRAATIVTTVKINEDPNALLVKELRARIHQLEAELRAERSASPSRVDRAELEGAAPPPGASSVAASRAAAPGEAANRSEAPVSGSDAEKDIVFTQCAPDASPVVCDTPAVSSKLRLLAHASLQCSASAEIADVWQSKDAFRNSEGYLERGCFVSANGRRVCLLVRSRRLLLYHLSPIAKENASSDPSNQSPHPSSPNGRFPNRYSSHLRRDFAMPREDGPVTAVRWISIGDENDCVELLVVGGSSGRVSFLSEDGVQLHSRCLLRRSAGTVCDFAVCPVRRLFYVLYSRIGAADMSHLPLSIVRLGGSGPLVAEIEVAEIAKIASYAGSKSDDREPIEQSCSPDRSNVNSSPAAGNHNRDVSSGSEPSDNEDTLPHPALKEVEDDDRDMCYVSLPTSYRVPVIRRELNLTHPSASVCGIIPIAPHVQFRWADHFSLRSGVPPLALIALGSFPTLSLHCSRPDIDDFVPPQSVTASPEKPSRRRGILNAASNVGRVVSSTLTSKLNDPPPYSKRAVAAGLVSKGLGVAWSWGRFVMGEEVEPSHEPPVEAEILEDHASPCSSPSEHRDPSDITSVSTWTNDVSLAQTLNEHGRQFNNAALSPSDGRFCAIADSMARIFVLDVSLFALVGCLKGRRDAHLAWLPRPEVDSHSEYAGVAFLAAYLPLRGVLEVIAVGSSVSPIAALSVGYGAHLISAPSAISFHVCPVCGAGEACPCTSRDVGVGNQSARCVDTPVFLLCNGIQLCEVTLRL